MAFSEILIQVVALLRQRGRVSYPAFERHFDLDHGYVTGRTRSRSRPRDVIDPALQIMMDAVHRYEGYAAQAVGRWDADVVWCTARCMLPRSLSAVLKSSAAKPRWPLLLGLSLAIFSTCYSTVPLRHSGVVIFFGE